MSLYKEAIKELSDEGIVRELYRFQGANSYKHLDIRTSKFNNSTRNNYLYFSNSIDHHEYFTIKRIKQLLNKLLLEETPYIISSKNITLDESFHQIKNLVLRSPKIEDLYSIKLVTNSNISKLLSENCTIQQAKHSRSIERVDRRVYGGGYGLSDEWKELLYLLTYFTSFHTIDRKDLLQLLTNMRITGKVNRKNNIDFIVKDPENYKFRLSPTMNNDFIKYNIRNCFDEIIESGKYLEDSELGTNPNKVVREVIDEYERGKEKVLTIFDRYYDR